MKVGVGPIVLRVGSTKRDGPRHFLDSPCIFGNCAFAATQANQPCKSAHEFAAGPENSTSNGA